MAFVQWLPNANGDWDTASNWSTGALPTSADDVVISTTTQQTISHSVGADFANSLTVGNDLFNMTGGALSVVAAASMADGFAMSGGTFSVGTSFTITGTYAQTGGSLSVGGTLSISGKTSLLGGYVGGTTVLNSTAAVLMSNYTIGGSALLRDTNFVYQTGNVTLGDATGVGAAISVAASATYEFANAVTLGSGASSAKLSNAGTILSLAGSGTSNVNVSVASTGHVIANQASGITFAGPLTSLSGTIQGQGTVSIAGGSATLAAAASVTVGTFAVYNNGTQLALGGNVTLASTFNQSNASTLQLAGHTLTLTGSAHFTQGNGTPTITGGGTLITNGASSFGGNGTGLVLSSGTSWTNAGLATLSQGVLLGDSASAAATLTNAAAGTLAIAAAGISVNSGSTPASKLVNAGTIAMTANGGTSNISAVLSSTGTISVGVSDTLEVYGAGNTLAGTISGAGTFAIAGGNDTIAGGTTITVANFDLYYNNSSLTLGGNVTVGGNYYQGWGSTLALGGHVLTIAGNAVFQQASGVPVVSGAGTLVTKGSTTIESGNPSMVLGSTATWQNDGLATLNTNMTVGNSNTANAAIVNEKTGTLNLVANNIGINNGSTPISTLTNIGTLEDTANAGTAYVGLDVTNSGIIKATQFNNLELDGAVNTIGGVLTGAGQISFANSSHTTFTATARFSVSTLGLYTAGTSLTFSGNVTSAGGYYQRDATVLNLGASTLTFSGPVTFVQSNGSPDVIGTGTLVTKGTTTLAGGGTPMIVGGGATWMNAGLAVQNGSLQVGDSGSASATVMNAAGATLLVNANNIRIANGGGASNFVNAGSLTMASNAGTSYDDVNTASTGAITVGQGDNFIFDAGTNSLGGTISGAGQISFSAGTTTLAAGTALSVGTVAAYNNGTQLIFAGTQTLSGGLYLASNSTLTLNGNASVTGFYQEYDNSVVSLGANTLTLAGQAQFQQGNGTPDIIGTGALVTSGVTRLTNANTTGITIGGSARWSNTGTVYATSSVRLGDSSGPTASLTNQAGATFELLANGASIVNGSTPFSSFVNAGLLEMAANGGGSNVTVNASSTGTILVLASDNLEFDGQTTNLGGSLGGAGQISIGGGTATLAAGAVITVGTLALYNNGSILSLGANETVAGSFAQSSGSTLALNGHTLTIAGAATFQSTSQAPLISGPGTLVTQGLTSLIGDNPSTVIGGSAAWNNAGTVLDYQSFQIGNSNTVAATTVNQASGVFDLVASVAITSGSTPASTFANAGLLEMTSVGGTSSLGLAVSNTGTILAVGGGLNMSGAVSGTGTLAVTAGGTLGFTNTVAATQSLKFLDNTSTANITLTSATSFGATISGFVQGDTIDLTNITNATGTFAAGVLTFTDNTSSAVVAKLKFTGAPNFTFKSDGHGGTIIGDPPKGAQSKAATPALTDHHPGLADFLPATHAAFVDKSASVAGLGGMHGLGMPEADAHLLGWAAFAGLHTS